MGKTIKKNQKIGKISTVEGLKAKFAEIENKKNTIDSKKIVGSNELKEVKAGLLQETFQLMRDAGVDLANLESINKFLAELGQKDPDLLELFQYAFGGMLGEEEGAGVINAPLQPEGGQALPVASPVGRAQPIPGQADQAPPLMNSFDNLRNETFRQ